jgi:hypothetical protein
MLITIEGSSWEDILVLHPLQVVLFLDQVTL